MTRTITDISASLDGFATGPDPCPDHGPDTRAKDLDVILTGGGAPIGSAGPRRLPVIR
ncbi:hypothetical protein O1Q96_27650 [Streptomyces sp. Qhu-G9]|uniref:hypothetical protein n=1 Tax=Streptomyces sp. Qhu-G9 TaxID=3452799 RepID=UPI0022AC302D|nr:hypothetical protein [Streptomyces aurantiacus]WAU83128.1 hypothetical protein O1Q96_27650 [Streptomyces aurantiacus]